MDLELGLQTFLISLLVGIILLTSAILSLVLYGAFSDLCLCSCTTYQQQRIPC